MTDKEYGPPPPIGFRLDYLPMSYEQNPVSESPFDPTVSALSYASGELTKNDSNNTSYVTKNCCFEFGCSWAHCDAAGPYPANLVRAGVDADGAIIYAGRSFHQGEMIPAKVIPDKQMAFISYGGEEIAKTDFEVLRSGDFVWEFAANGTVPEGAVQIGTSSDGETLYMGRTMYQGTQTPGKVQCSHGCLYIPFAGEEVALTEYEVLCLK